MLTGYVFTADQNTYSPRLNIS